MNTLIFYDNLKKDYKHTFGKNLNLNNLTSDEVYKLYKCKHYELDNENKVLEIY